MDVRNMVRAALFAALIAICAWVTLPLGGLVFTLQTLGIFLALLVLGGKWGTVSILVYLLTGLAGAPVFSGFRGGVSAFLMPTGGYLIGFLLCGLAYWAVTACKGRPVWGLLVGLAVCYGAAGLWALRLYHHASIALYLLPYILPDLGKLLLALWFAKRLRKILQHR